jgi:hypothetical protein
LIRVENLKEALGIEGAAGPGDRHDEFHSRKDTRDGRGWHDQITNRHGRYRPEVPENWMDDRQRLDGRKHAGRTRGGTEGPFQLREFNSPP